MPPSELFVGGCEKQAISNQTYRVQDGRVIVGDALHWVLTGRFSKGPAQGLRTTSSSCSDREAGSSQAAK